MRETRAGKYGRNLAILLNHTINTVPIEQRADYRTRFLEELKKYSFEPRQKGQPQNSGCIHELAHLTEIDTGNPEDLARLVKEGVHLMYQKSTAALVLSALLKYM